eukprot:TRINITY_DN8601_c0_g1_i2.p1 TRINITY_DN8601_c0_g1~~TRINITY_DN8601_c0_g1_i2.p1  ORF type:complete len:160 (+),score=11.84 TRINITY_DN8601_c0_g1_i2:76-555(+)
MAQNFRWINDGPASPPVKIGAVVSEPSFKPSGTVLCSGRYNGNRQTKQFLFVNHGNVLEENVDGLVCPTDKDFSMCAGLSRVVYEKAGKSFQQQIEQMRANISNRGTGKCKFPAISENRRDHLYLFCFYYYHFVSVFWFFWFFCRKIYTPINFPSQRYS